MDDWRYPKYSTKILHDNATFFLLGNSFTGTLVFELPMNEYNNLYPCQGK